jgi:hypothetical protein
MEPLEDRRMMATFTWNGGGGDSRWANPQNWDLDSVPSIDSDVVVPAGSMVLLDEGILRLRSLDLQSSIQLLNAQLEVVEDFSVATGLQIEVAGTDASLIARDESTMLQSVSLIVSGGGELELHSNPSFANTTGDTIWRTTGAGSTLRMPNVTSINAGSAARQDVFLQAYSGGLLDLPSLTQLIVPSASSDKRALRVLADGTDSRVLMPMLSSFSDFQVGLIGDFDGNSGTRNEYSELVARAGGTITTGENLQLRGIYLPLNSGSVFNAAKIGSLVDSHLTIDGITPNFNNVADISGTDIYVTEGAHVEFPLPTSIVNPVTLDNDTVWRTTGAGSVLRMPNVASINAGSAARQDVFLQAYSGGLLDLPSLTQLIVPSASTDKRALRVLADGTDSRVQMPMLSSFSDFQVDLIGDFDSNSGTRYEYSELVARAGGTITTGENLQLRGIYLPLNSGSVFNAAKIGSLVDSHLTIDGITPNLNNVADISGTDIFVTGGAHVEFSLPTSIVNPVTLDNDTVWRTTGVGSTLRMPNVASINAGSAARQDVFLQAYSGGLLDLPSLTQLIVPSASTDKRALRVLADGTDSRVLMPMLRSFSDFQVGLIGDFDGNSGTRFEYSELVVRAGGVVRIGDQTRLQGVYVAIDEVSKVFAGVITLDSSSILTGSGWFYGDLVNNALVALDAMSQGLSVFGDYRQTATGKLSIALRGPLSEGLSPSLSVRGAAQLGGSLEVQRLNGFEPDVWSDYVMVRASQRTGEFHSITGLGISEPHLNVTYGQSVVVISRNFDRPNYEEFEYFNDTPGRRVFFDVLSTIEGRVSFRLKNPNDDLVFVSNSLVADPDKGDFGGFPLNEVGMYRVQMFRDPAQSPISTFQMQTAPNRVVPLTLNQVLIGSIELPGERIAYRFEIDRPSPVHFAMSSMLGGQLRWTLRTESGRVINSAVASTDSPLPFQFEEELDRAGVYFLEVEGHGDDTADFQFSLELPEQPRILGASLRGNSVDSVDAIWIAFNQAMDESAGNFDVASDVLEVSDGSLPLKILGSRWHDPKTLVLELESQPSDGLVVLVLSPDIRSVSGSFLDQDRDGIAGEPVEDRFSATLRKDTTHPRVIFAEPRDRASAPIDSLSFISRSRSTRPR